MSRCADGPIIGGCGIGTLRGDGPEIGYWFGVAHWGHGYATEAARAIIDHAFGDLGHEVLHAGARVSNPASRRVLEKCGFQWTGVVLQRVRALGSSAPCDRFRLDRAAVGIAAELGQGETDRLTKETSMPAPFTIIGLDHVVLRARDPAALEKFYVEVLGCSLELRQGKLAQLRAGRTLIDIVPDGRGGRHARAWRGANLDHLCLRVEPFDAGAIAQHLAAHGVQCGEEASRYGAEGRGPSVYLNDPEGNGVELKGPVKG